MGNSRRFGWRSGVLTRGYIYLKSRYTSDLQHGMRLEFTKNFTSNLGSPRALTLWCCLKAASGYAGAGGVALHANLYLGAGNGGVVGEAHAAASQLIIASDTRSVNGTYCAHKFVNEIGANNTMQADITYFCRFHDAGAVKTPMMFDFSNLTADAANCIVANAAAPQNLKYALRVRSPDGTIDFIPICGTLG